MQGLHFKPTIFSWSNSFTLQDTKRDPNQIVSILVSLSSMVTQDIRKILNSRVAADQQKALSDLRSFVFRTWSSLEVKLMDITESHVDFNTYLYLCDVFRHGWICALLDLFPVKRVPEEFYLVDFMRIYNILPPENHLQFVIRLFEKEGFVK